MEIKDDCQSLILPLIPNESTKLQENLKRDDCRVMDRLRFPTSPDWDNAGGFDDQADVDAVLAKLVPARHLLAEAQSIPEVKAVADVARAAEIYFQRQKQSDDIIKLAHEIKIDAFKRLGELLAAMPKNPGTRTLGGGGGAGGPMMVPPENTPRLEDLCLTKKESADAQFLATVAKDKPEMYGAIRRRELSIPKARRECQREATIIKLTRIAAQSPADISGRFDVIVCDPPWPVEKIERDVAPNQVALDYPTMSLGELAEWPGVVDKAEPNCHLWLWTTPKFLPNAIELVKEWGFSYVCCHVWHKPGGFQPFGLPQYNCEFAVYARKGSPLFKETKDFPLCFTAPRTGHSEKPDAFYERVRRVTAGRRLDMFNRRRIPGFIGWGNEAPICKADAWMHGQFQPQRSSE